MTDVTRLLPDPKFRITLVHHPKSARAAALAATIETHFFGDAFRDASPGLGIDVGFRSAGAAVGDERPIAIPFDGGRCDAVVLIADDVLVESIQNGGAWDDYLDDLADDVAATQRASNIFVIALDRSALPVHRALADVQHIRWCDWDDAGRERRLLRELTHAFCVLIRPWVDAVENGTALPPQNIADDPEHVTIFISHSKSDGAELASSVRDQILKQSQLGTFFDTYDIMPGTTFAKVIENRIRKSVVLVVLTDTFASREWCRLEVLTARRLNIPVVVLHALKEREPRSFPYLGNVPVVAGASGESSRIAEAVGALLDESLESLYWRLHRKDLQSASGDPDALVIAHAPDLLTLVQCDPMPKTIVYPDPPLGGAESELIGKLAKDVKLRTPMSLFVE